MKIEHKMCGSFSYSIALKKSGKFDLYWDQQRKYSSTDLHAVDIALTTKTLFFKFETLENGKQNIWKIDHKDSRVLNWEMADQITHPEFRFDHIHHYEVSELIALYRDLAIGQSSNNTYTVVAHSCYLSLFNMIKNKWVKHVKFTDGNIAHFSQMEKSDNVSDLMVVTESGSFYFLTYNDISNEKKNPLVIEKKDASFSIEGELKELKVENYYQSYALARYTPPEAETKLAIIHNRKLYDFKPKDFDLENFDDYSYIMPIQTSSAEEILVLRQDIYKNLLVVYHIDQNAEQPADEQKAEEHQDGNAEENQDNNGEDKEEKDENEEKQEEEEKNEEE